MARPPFDENVPPENVLLVEGINDLRVIATLCGVNGIPERFVIKEMDDDEIGQSGGYEKIYKDVPNRLKVGNQRRLGIVVDADTDLERRWMSLRDLLSRSGYSNVPNEPLAEGLTLPAVVRSGQKDLPIIGVWIMPNNTLPGALEEFVRFLVPPEHNALWEHAEVCVANLPVKPDPLTENWKAKARIHSYLAWQEQPGKPMGQAITQKYLAGNAEAAQPFLDWLRRLFELPPAA